MKNEKTKSLLSIKNEIENELNKKDSHYDKDNFIIEENKLVGKGSFGRICMGKNKITNEEIACKLEPINTPLPQLIYEYKIYRFLQNGYGFPKVYCFYKDAQNYVLIMELLGVSLETLFNKAKKQFSLITVIMIVDQILTRLEYLHSKNLLHRDIKPDNFLVGRGSKMNTIYAIDFGLSKKYKDSKTGLHIPYRDGKDLTGTARYVSINTHLGVEQSRRDDIESLGYMMIYFLKGHLPWQGMIDNDHPKKKYDRIKKIKIETKLTDLCANLPKECIKFIQYARDMKFEDKPNYNYLRGLLRKIAKKNNLLWDTSKFDWFIDQKNMINTSDTK